MDTFKVLSTLLFYFVIVFDCCDCAKFGVNKNRLEFLVEPESVFAAADGRRETFKCTASIPEATIKWLHNGTIITNDSHEWIKVTNNKLVIKMQKKSFHLENYTPNSFLRSDEFQCLAEWNNQVIVSQPAKLIVAELHPFEQQETTNISAIVGNTVMIPCVLPRSIPFAVAEFEFNNITIDFNNGNK